MKLTDRETQVLDLIARNLYQPVNGAVPDTYADTSAIWSMLILDSSSEFAGTFPKRSLSGVCASLAKKGLVEAYDYKIKRDNTIALTESGFAAWQTSATVAVHAGGRS